MSTRTEPPLLLSVFPTFAVGGQQARFAALANRLGAAWRHAIVAMNGDHACLERLDPGLDVTVVTGGTQAPNPLALYRQQRAVLRDLRPDLLLTHNWGSIEWALANRFPRRLVPHLHAEDGFGPEERVAPLRRRSGMRRVLLRRSTVVLPSNTLRRIAGRHWRLPPHRLRHAPHGVDLDRFAVRNPLPPLPEWGLTGTGPVIGTVAALRPEKNLARLLHAVAAIAHPSRLLVVGDGPERAALERLAATLMPLGRVAFVGHMPDPPQAYRHMDLFALSSDTEQMPLSLLEAMASGLAVASTDVGDVALMLGDGHDGLVTALDAAALAAALDRLVADPALCRRLGDDNRARAVLLYDERQMIGRWAALLADAR